MSGAAYYFDIGRLNVHQALLWKPTADRRSTAPWSRAYMYGFSTEEVPGAVPAEQELAQSDKIPYLPSARLSKESREPQAIEYLILLKNPPFILREPQDERKRDRNHWRFFRSR
ncbi:MAG: hypothetical protein HYW03_05860 [Deltaproteobacteria bacterium]|nr:hypothetical protein [Deltaproteobacteria bacterium]